MIVVSLQRYVAPAINPVSLEIAKAHLKIDGAEEDALLAEYIETATAWAEDFCERGFIEQTMQMLLDGFPDDGENIRLPWGRSISVTSFNYVNADGGNADVDEDIYGSLTGIDDGEIYLLPGETWPKIYASDAPSAVSVYYKVGYGATTASVPAPIRGAIRLLTEHQYRTRGPLIIGETSVANELGVDKMLMPFRSMRAV